jgi:TonB-dependent receptor
MSHTPPSVSGRLLVWASLIALVPAGCLLFASSPVPAATQGTGSLEGRVFNTTTGTGLANVRLRVETTGRETFTDSNGAYRLNGVPADGASVSVSYLGFPTQTVTVVVRADSVTTRDIEISARGAERLPPPGETVRLEAFTVVADREMSAQAVAMNEQRHAPNLKNVVAIDEFGDRGTENIGDFIRFIPGVSINDDGLVPNDVILRGFPSGNSGIMVDGGEFASSRGTSRTVSLLEVPMGNISRVEVTKVPTPDLPASGLGGTINLISKSGFEVRRPVFTGQVYTIFNSLAGLRLDGGPRGPIPTVSPDTIQPSFNFSYLRPVNKNLAFSFGGARTWRQQPMDALDEVATWNFVDNFQRQTLWQSVAQVLITTSGQLGVDWRITPRDVVSASLQYRDARNFTARNSLTVAYGTGATGGPTFTQGATTGVGTVTLGSGVNQLIGTETLHLNLKYARRSDVWRLDAAGTWSHSDSANEDTDRGHFATTPSSVSSVIIRGDGMGVDGSFIPTNYRAATRTGVPVDLYDGGNYSIVTATSAPSKNRTVKTAGRLDAARDFTGALPFTLKAGLAVDRMDRDLRSFGKTWNFRPNGLTDAASRLAGRFEVFDEAFNATAPTLYGQRMRWISTVKLFQLYEQRPEWFVLDEALAYQNQVAGSRQLIETISAAYLRADVRLLRNRLWLVAGVRLEQTEDDGRGSLDDPSAQYQKDARGNLVRNAAGQLVFLTTDALARTRLRYVERGSHSARDYRDIYPSLNATFSVSDNLVLRGAYARTIGRPALGLIIPGVTFSDPAAVNPTITVTNTGLKPWTADNFDLSVESYQLKDGFGSLGVFQKNISNFFGATSMPATPELLALYGLPDDEVYLNYDINTQTNVGTARVTGLEFFYRQSLTFLPSWVRGLQIFGNATKLRLEGNRTADFTGFNPLSYSGGLNLIRARWFLKLTCTHQDEARRDILAVSAANGVPTDTYNYQGATTRWSLAGQYSLTKRFAFYGTMTDLGGFELVTRRYAPKTPDYAKDQRRQVLGSTITLGLKGQF